jgi:hypothetical protein
MTEVNVRIIGFSRIDYNSAPVRKALRQQINPIRDLARALVSSAPTSAPGEYPGKRTGVLRRAIKSKVLRSGLAAVARPEKTPRMGKYYYPAFLLHGVKKRDGHAVTPGLKPRKDYMTDALEQRTGAATEAIREALQLALVPRK